jgi:adenosylhomocysteine nucleosidase
VILIACGLQREARVMARNGTVVIGGGDAARLEAELEALIASGKELRFPPFGQGSEQSSPSTSSGKRVHMQAMGIHGVQAILSSGIAGAVDRTLKAGDVVIDGDFVEVLRKILPGARVGRVIGSDAIVPTVAAKQALFQKTGALAVDMESHIAARVAARHGLPFAALRVISDTATEALPPAALIGMQPDGEMALGAVLASLVRNPAQLPALIRTGVSAGRAFRSLERCHDVLGRGGIGELDFGEFALDV